MQVLVYFSMQEELDVGAVSRRLSNRNRSLKVFMRGQKSPTLFVARLWDASLQCTKGGTVSEGRLAGSAAVRISFLGWLEGGRVQKQSKQALFRRERHLNPPCLYGERVVASTEMSRAVLGQPKAPSRHKTSSSSSYSIYLMRFLKNTLRAVLPLAQTPSSWQSLN